LPRAVATAARRPLIGAVLDHPSARTSLGPGGAHRVRPFAGFFKKKI